MAEKRFQQKLLSSAFSGFFVAAFLVFIPGTLFMAPSRRQGPAQEILGIYHDKFNLGLNAPAEVRGLLTRSFWLCIVQNELDCFPFLFLCASVGPAVLLVRRVNEFLSEEEVP